MAGGYHKPSVNHQASAQTAQQNGAGYQEEELAEFFCRWRNKAGLSIAEATDFLMLDNSDVLKGYEDGSIDIPLEMIFSLVNLYNIPPEEVLNSIYGL